jgi:hypothetical protein
VCWAPSGLLSSCSPLTQVEKLGVSTYERRLNRKKRDALQIGDWKGNENKEKLDLGNVT